MRREMAGTQEKNRRPKWGIVVIIALAVVSTVAAAGIFAKYITETNRRKSEMIAASFYFTSDKLDETENSYSVRDWKENGITFEVYNYQPENRALIASEDITYSVTPPSGWAVSVTDQAGSTVTPADGKYTFPKTSECAKHTVKLSYTGTGTPAAASVTVTSASPFTKTIKAKFIPEEETLPSYEITDMGEYELVKIKAENYSGTVTVTWDGVNHSPDNTDPLMKDWTNAAGSGTITVTPDTQTELILLENVPQTYETKTGKSTTVPAD